MKSFKQDEKIRAAVVCGDCHLPVNADEVKGSGQETCSCRSENVKIAPELSSDSSENTIAPEGNASPPLPAASRNPVVGSRNKESEPISSVKSNFSQTEAQHILGQRFSEIELLGGGGMGTVFKAHDQVLGKTVAVKLLNPQLLDDENSLLRFEREAKAAMSLTHPHLAAVYEHGIGIDGTPFLVMDYLEGTTLDALLKVEGSIAYERAIDLFLQLCESVSYAHSMGVVHRDIKPSNIIITKDASDAEYLKLFDFGIARVLPHQCVDLTHELTPTGDLFGSPLYMSPEQCKGESADEKSDLFSIGCVMYKLLIGTHPFEAKSFIETVTRITNADAPKFSRFNLNSKIPAALEEIVRRCLSKDPKNRYDSVAALANDLKKLRDGKTISISKQQRQVNKQRLQRLLLSGVLVISALAGIKYFADSPYLNIPGISQWTPESYDRDRLHLAEKYLQAGRPAMAIEVWHSMDVPRAEDSGVAEYCKKHLFTYNPDQADLLYRIANAWAVDEDYAIAAKYYQIALRAYQLHEVPETRYHCWWSNRPTAETFMPKAISEYASLLKKFSREKEGLDMMAEYIATGKIKTVPAPGPFRP